MKETVTDIADVQKSMNEKLGSIQKTIESQHDTICNLNRNINKLNAEVGKGNAIIEDLKKRLAKYETPDKNSNTSSTPPSKEKMKDEVVRRTKTLRKTSGLKPGGQAGHKGSTLLKTESPDSVENIVPITVTNAAARSKTVSLCWIMLHR